MLSVPNPFQSAPAREPILAARRQTGFQVPLVIPPESAILLYDFGIRIHGYHLNREPPHKRLVDMNPHLRDIHERVLALRIIIMWPVHAKETKQEQD